MASITTMENDRTLSKKKGTLREKYQGGKQKGVKEI